MSRDQKAPLSTLGLEDFIATTDLPSEDVQATFCAVVVETWAQQGLTYAAVAPGSRSTPLTLALMADERIAVDVFHDERSAAFAALGFGVATGRTALAVCTSGTAAAHFYAAVIEADLSGIPLLVCTADRPPELRDVGAPQTIDQTKMFGTSVRWYHDPGVAMVANAASWRSMAARSVAATTGLHPGPVHLNMPFREPLVGQARTVSFGSPEPQFDVGRLFMDSLAITMLAERVGQSSNGVIIAGNRCGEPSVVNGLAEHLGWPIFADSRSGCQGQSQAVIHFDSLLRVDELVASLKPQLVLRLGESPASKVLNQWVATSGAFEIHVTDKPSVYDPQHRVGLHLTADPTDLCQRLTKEISASSIGGDSQSRPWQRNWLAGDLAARKVLSNGDDGDLADGIRVARGVVSGVHSGSRLVISSSMPIRDVEWFGGDCSNFVVHANRGANGIDGVIATSVGVARGSGMSTTALIGDVALIHDSSTLASLAHLDVDLRLVVVDNNGGGIFHHLPQASIVPADVFEKVYGTPHRTDVVQWARAVGIPAETVATRAELHRALSAKGPRLIRVETHRVDDVAAHRRTHAAVADAVRVAITGG